MNRKSLVLGIVGILLLAGAGCTDSSENPSVNTKPAETVSSSTTSAPVETTNPSSTNTAEGSAKAVESITLTGTALGPGAAQFNWTLSPADAKTPPALHLVRSQNENPTQPPAYWFRQFGNANSAVWIRLPHGEEHFRICVWEGGKCGVYSNDVVVNVK